MWTLALACVGCASEHDQLSRPAADGAPMAVGAGVPRWVLDIPSEPGLAFYGVGSATFDTLARREDAIRQADAAAARQLADSMKTLLKGAIKSFCGGQLTADSDINEERLPQDVTVAVIGTVPGESVVVHRAVDANVRPHVVYTLIRLDFACLAAKAVNALATVRRRAVTDAGADRLAACLKDEQERNLQYSAPPSGVPVGERTR
ncbi:MAG: hypothetical protein AB7S36_01255 [Planctomycetota bacterium]